MGYEDDQIDGYYISEIRQYLEKNEEEYLRRFKQAGRIKIFNGAAAFFGSVWFAYRMLWLEGILLWLFSSVVLLIVTFIMYIMFLVNFLHTKESAYLVLFLFWVVKFIVVGKLADSIYWRKIKKRINAAHGEDEKNQSKLKQLANGIECKGVSIWSAVIMFILLEFGNVLVGLISIFMAIMISCLR